MNSDNRNYLRAAAEVLERCDALAAHSEEKGRITRRFATPALWSAGEAVAGWMGEIGMAVRRDAIGNVIGRRGEAGAPTLLLGSHLDSVPNAGRYDGPLGLLVALAALELATDLPYAVELYGFSDEEGTRYRTAYLGSGAVCGRLDPADLARTDADGVTMAQALRDFGGDPDGLAAARRDASDVLGYCEVHIEQGPVLEERGVPVGPVTGIAGQTRVTVTFTGLAAHAGTVPMALRRDALAAAAELVLTVEALARATDGLVATVGELDVAPGASNVIPARASLSLDVRHVSDDVRAEACALLCERTAEIARLRGVGHEWEVLQQTAATPCDARLTALLSEAVSGAGHELVPLSSGAGHDAAVMSHLGPVAMLFVRCAGGVSHHPDEAVTVEDVAAAIDVITRFLRSLA